MPKTHIVNQHRKLTAGQITLAVLGLIFFTVGAGLAITPAQVTAGVLRAIFGDVGGVAGDAPEAGLPAPNASAQTLPLTATLYLPYVIKQGPAAPPPPPPLTCDHTIDLATTIVDARSNYRGVSPGDTVCIEAGNRSYITIRNFTGSADKPITFVNVDGQVVINSTNTHGILVQNSRFVRITGSGDNSIAYGIRIIKSQGHGVRIGDKSSNFEVDRIEISGVQTTGMLATTFANCPDGSTNDYDYDGDGQTKWDLDDVVNRSNFSQYNSTIHHNYIHNTGKEGIYLGSSAYGREQTIACANGNQIQYDPVLRGVNIYNNRVEDTGWDAIQAGSAIAACQVHHNTIRRDSLSNVDGQQSGIMNNPGSVCNIYGNFIKDGGGPGIYLQGNGNNRVYNNIIINAGKNGGGRGNGITVATGSNTSGSIYVWHNTIVKPRDYGIKYFNDGGNGSKIQNNIVAEPGGIAAYGNQAYIDDGGRTNVQVSSNLNGLHVTDIKFANPAVDDYALLSTSPGVDTGVNLSSQGITSDFFDRQRPRGLGYDKGAVEL